MVFCRYCGTKLLADAKFCTKCGAAVAPPQATQAQTRTFTTLGRIMAILSVVFAVMSAVFSSCFVLFACGVTDIQTSMPVVASVLSVQPIAALVMAGIGRKQGCTGKMVTIATILSILAVIAYGISIPVMFAQL
jgi:hypothetical protein